MLKTAMTWSGWRWEGIVTLIASRRGVSSHVLLHLRNAVNMGGGLSFFFYGTSKPWMVVALTIFLFSCW